MSPTQGSLKRVADPVDEHALADLERRHHRLRRDPVGLDEEGLDAEREPERHGDDHDQLQQRAGRRFAALLALRVSEPGPRWPRPPRRRRRRRSASASACSSTASPGTSASAARRRLGLCRGIVQQARLDDLLRARVAALADAGALADAAAQVVELRAADVAAGGDLDALDLRRVHGERALDADAEGLLADREGLAHAFALALDDHALEHLGPPARALDDLEVHADAVAGLEARGRGGAARARGCR